MSATRYEWTLIDYAIWTAGAVTVPVYETSSAEQIEWISATPAPAAMFAETAAHAATIGAAADRLPGLDLGIWKFDELGSCPRRRHDAGGADRGPGQPPDAARRRRPGHDHLHVGHHRPAQGLRADPPQPAVRRRATRWPARWPTCSREPGSVHPAVPAAGAQLRPADPGRLPGVRRPCSAHYADTSTLAAGLAGVPPTFLLAVPRVFEKVYSTRPAAARPPRRRPRRRIFDRAAAAPRSPAARRRTAPPARPRPAAPARAVRPAGLRQAAGGRGRPGAATRSPAARRSATGSATSSAASGSPSSRATG